MIPDTDDQRKRVLLVLQSKFEERGTTMDAFTEERGYDSRAYLTRLISGKRGESETFLLDEMATFLELPSADFPFGITDDDFAPIQDRLLETQVGRVGEEYREEVEINSENWKEMTPERMKELVWQHPSSVVGLMCGVSDVAIGKYCRKHNVEKPPRGYWAKQGRYKPNPSGR